MTWSLFVLAAALFAVANTAKIPPSWKVCRRSLPPEEYEPCIYDAVRGVIKDLLECGEPTLQIAPLDPLKIATLEINQGTGAVAINLKFRDMEITSLKTIEISKLRHKDAEKLKVGVDFNVKKPVIIKAKYESRGKLLAFPIKGQGNCELQLYNLHASMNLSGVPFKKGQEWYANITTFDFDFNTDKLFTRYENLFDGNKELSDSMNAFMNENSGLILTEMKPAINEAFSQAFKAIANRILHALPYRLIMPA